MASRSRTGSRCGEPACRPGAMPARPWPATLCSSARASRERAGQRRSSPTASAVPDDPERVRRAQDRPVLGAQRHPIMNGAVAVAGDVVAQPGTDEWVERDTDDPPGALAQAALLE